MAFDFLDLFPDTPAAVAASQGARDILENQHKQSMGAIDLEKALMQTMQMKKQIAEQQAMEPLTKTVESIKLLQGLNLPGQNPFADVNIADRDALNNYLLRKAPELQTNVQVDLEKAKAQGLNSYEKALLTTNTSKKNNTDDNETAIRKENLDAAQKRLEKWTERNGTRTPKNANKQAELVQFFQGLAGAYGPSNPSVREMYGTHRAFFEANGIGPDGSRAPKKDTKKAGQPPTLEIDGYVFQKVNGKIVQVK